MAHPVTQASGRRVERGQHGRGALLRWGSILLGLALVGVGVTLIMRIDRTVHPLSLSHPSYPGSVSHPGSASHSGSLSHPGSLLEEWCRAIQVWLPWLPC